MATPTLVGQVSVCVQRHALTLCTFDHVDTKILAFRKSELGPPHKKIQKCPHWTTLVICRTACWYEASRLCAYNRVWVEDHALHSFIQ